MKSGGKSDILRAFWISRLCVILAFITVLTFFPISSSVMGNPFDNTTLSISPTSQTIEAGENFSIDVYCAPSQPIKAFEFRFSFDATLLEVSSVVEGDIFSNFTTFFNNGTINNTVGNIVDIYGLIVGTGNVTDNGTLVTISFTAKEYSGTSQLEFIDIGTWTGVTDETGYIPINTSPGSVEITGGGSPPNPPPPPPGGGGYFPPPGDENNPPMMPLKPSGPTFVEMGVEYTYSSSTIDPDGDQIRIKFDWGDGNVSEWSNFVDSNTTVSMSHNWSQIQTFSVRAIAQDIHGLNSSWSTPLNVTVSQENMGIPPVVIISVSDNNFVNETIIFNASGSYDPDGFIVTYEWDFGDGKVDSGVNISHVFKQPGEYIVTLDVTDNNGTIYSKSIMIKVTIKQEDAGSGEHWIFLPFNVVMLICGSIISVIVCLTILLRDRITLKILKYELRRIEKRKNRFTK